MKKPPLAEVNERFQSKEALVDELVKTLEAPGDESRDEWKARLVVAPNSKLLRLYDNATEVNERFGDREQLLDAVCKLKFAGRQVEDAWRTKAASWSDGRLLDLHRSLARAARTAVA